jgi:benzylsuccinate CoA-transferase BbsF subunit
MQIRKGLFEGLNVLDFTWAGVGPRTTRYLAEYGASVVKIESALRPDPLRTMPPFTDDISGLNRSQTFARHNGNKYSVAINLNHPRADQVIRKLVAWSDIITESFTPGTLDRWGLNYEELSKIKPDIIMLSTSMQGQTGLDRAHPGYGIPLTSLSGFTNITGWPDRAPSGTYGPYTDFVAPLFNLIALLSALDYRRRTGKGQYLDLSQNECAMHFLAPVILDYVVNGREFNRRGNRSSRAAPHGVYPCSDEDRWCAIAVFSDEEWQSFCGVIGSPDWTNDARFATLQDRIRNNDELDKLVAGWTVNHSPAEVMALMQAAGVPAGVVETGEDLAKDPQLMHYNAFPIVDHPEMGSCALQRASVKLTKSAPCEATRAPLLGEHTEFVCTQLLCMSDEEFIELLNSGVFE